MTTSTTVTIYDLNQLEKIQLVTDVNSKTPKFNLIIDNQSLVLETEPVDKLLENAFICHGIRNNQFKNTVNIPFIENSENSKALLNALNIIERKVRESLPADAVLQPLLTLPKEYGRPPTFNVYFNSYTTFTTPNQKLIENPFITLKTAFKAVLFVDFTSVSYSEKSNKWYINTCLNMLITNAPKVIGSNYFKSK
jgi:hypothetical protein